MRRNYIIKGVENEEKMFRRSFAMMRLQEVRRLRKRKVSRGIITHVERNSFLHGKKKSNNNLIIIKFTYICVAGKQLQQRGATNRRVVKESNERMFWFKSH
jgi:hypothetical protein